jgi:hypothetical protein
MVDHGTDGKCGDSEDGDVIPAEPRFELGAAAVQQLPTEPRRNQIFNALYSLLQFLLYDCADQPYIFSWPMVISSSVNEFFVAV